MTLPAGRFIALAAVAGVLAGGLAVYVMGSPSGNNPTVAGSTSSGEVASCPQSVARAEAVGEAAKGEVAAMLAADPARRMPPLSFTGPDGQAMSLADFAGKTVLVNLWATWCAPCRAEMPALDTLETEMGGEAFEVVAINVDTGGDEKPKAFLDETGVSALGYYRDASMEVFNALKRESLVLGLPATLLVDGDGCLLGHMNGPAEWASEDAKALIGAALGS